MAISFCYARISLGGHVTQTSQAMSGAVLTHLKFTVALDPVAVSNSPPGRQPLSLPELRAGGASANPSYRMSWVK